MKISDDGQRVHLEKSSGDGGATPGLGAGGGGAADPSAGGPRPAGAGRGLSLILIGAVLLAALFLARYLPRRAAERALAAEASQAATGSPRVDVVSPKVRGGERALELPGSVRPLEETVIYPRASGYVRRWRVDIGDVVKEGQVLAEIDTPELDQQLEQARATLGQREAALLQARANQEYSLVELRRYESLAPSGVASQQELEQKRAQAAVDEANVRAAEAARLAQQASIRQLLELKSFARVTAPFAGRITMRSIDRGALVTAGNGNGQALFRIAATDPVRVFIEVPQDLAPSVRPGLGAAVSVREYPGRVFEGTVARAAGALDAASRTMTTEVRVANDKGELMAGMYAQVKLKLQAPHQVFVLPASALITTAAGTRVAIVDEQMKIRLLRIVVERDDGAEVEVSEGLEGGERVVKNPGARIRDGLEVQLAAR